MTESDESVLNRMAHVALLNAVACDINIVYNLADNECRKAALEKAQEEGSCYLLLQTGLRRETTWFEEYCKALHEESRNMSDPKSAHGFTTSHNWIQTESGLDDDGLPINSAIGLLVTLFYGPVTQM